MTIPSVPNSMKHCHLVRQHQVLALHITVATFLTVVVCPKGCCTHIQLLTAVIYQAVVCHWFLKSTVLIPVCANLHSP